MYVPAAWETSRSGRFSKPAWSYYIKEAYVTSITSEFVSRAVRISGRYQSVYSLNVSSFTSGVLRLLVDSPFEIGIEMIHERKIKRCHYFPLIR